MNERNIIPMLKPTLCNNIPPLNAYYIVNAKENSKDKCLKSHDRLKSSEYTANSQQFPIRLSCKKTGLLDGVFF